MRYIFGQMFMLLIYDFWNGIHFLLPFERNVRPDLLFVLDIRIAFFLFFGRKKYIFTVPYGWNRCKRFLFRTARTTFSLTFFFFCLSFMFGFSSLVCYAIPSVFGRAFFMAIMNAMNK